MEVAWKMSEQLCEQVNGQFCFDLIHMNQKFTFSLIFLDFHIFTFKILLEFIISIFHSISYK